MWLAKGDSPRAVLLVEDDAILQRTWKRILGSAGFGVTGVKNLADARNELGAKLFHVVLLDLRLENELGTALLPELKQLCPRPGVALISGFLDANVATDAGISGVIAVPKPMDAKSLIKLAKSLANQHHHNRDGFCDRHSLSPRELQLVRSAANGFSNKQIADVLGCSEATVATYWQRIFDKTGARSRNAVLALLIHCPRRGHTCGRFLETDWQSETPCHAPGTGSVSQ